MIIRTLTLHKQDLSVIALETSFYNFLLFLYIRYLVYISIYVRGLYYNEKYQRFDSAATLISHTIRAYQLFVGLILKRYSARHRATTTTIVVITKVLRSKSNLHQQYQHCLRRIARIIQYYYGRRDCTTGIRWTQQCHPGEEFPFRRKPNLFKNSDKPRENPEKKIERTEIGAAAERTARKWKPAAAFYVHANRFRPGQHRTDRYYPGPRSYTGKHKNLSPSFPARKDSSTNNSWTCANKFWKFWEHFRQGAFDRRI